MKSNYLMKALFFICFISLSVSIQSCMPYEKSPECEYSLTEIRFVPDSLKAKQRLWITETIKAASQHMTGGDYEDVDETINQAKLTSDEIFEVEVLGLYKNYRDPAKQNLEILPKDMTPYEKKVMDSLMSIK